MWVDERVFLLAPRCSSGACDFSVANTYCSYDRKIKSESSKNKGCGKQEPGGEKTRADRGSARGGGLSTSPASEAVRR